MDQAGMPYWATLPLAAIVCFVFGFLMGFPALGWRGTSWRWPPSRWRWRCRSC
jgi:ABC-type branched-subunit amino acid transport system permease subunit